MSLAFHVTRPGAVHLGVAIVREAARGRVANAGGVGRLLASAFPDATKIVSDETDIPPHLLGGALWLPSLGRAMAVYATLVGGPKFVLGDGAESVPVLNRTFPHVAFLEFSPRGNVPNAPIDGVELADLWPAQAPDEHLSLVEDSTRWIVAAAAVALLVFGAHYVISRSS